MSDSKPNPDTLAGPLAVHYKFENGPSGCPCTRVPPTAKKRVYGVAYSRIDIVNFVRFRTGRKREIVEEIFDEIFHFIGQQLARGRQVLIPGFGTWYHNIRPGTIHKSMFLPEVRKIPPRKLLHFRLAERLRSIWNEAKFDLSDPTKEWPTLFADMRRKRRVATRVYRKLVEKRNVQRNVQ